MNTDTFLQRIAFELPNELFLSTKLWISQQGKKVSNLVTSHHLFQKIFQPLYNRYFQPLSLTHRVLLIGIPPLAVLTGVAAFHLLSPVAFLSVLFVEALTVPFIIARPLKFLTTLHYKEALPYLEKLKTAVEKNNLKEVKENLTILKSPQFSFIKEEVIHLDKVLDELILSPVSFKDKKGIFLIEIDQIFIKFGIQQSSLKEGKSGAKKLKKNVKP